VDERANVSASGTGGMDRRSFFRIVATSGAAAAAAGCNPPAGRLLPYVVPPENVVPGVASWFATVCRECPAGCGVIARNREGRVVKLEGNPEHPLNAGRLCVRGQAALQGLYHPDRFQGPLAQGKPIAWDEAEKQLAERLGALAGAGRGGRIALVGGIETGSLGRLMDRFVEAVGARPRLAWEPIGYAALQAANRATFGRDAIPHYAIDEATYLLSFGADFLETWLNNVRHAAEFGRMHGFQHGRTGTAVHVEPRQSLTAASADEWVRNAPGTEGLVALAMLRVIVDDGLVTGPDRGAVEAAARAVDVAAAAQASGVSEATIKRIAHAFAASKGGLAIGGGAAVTGPNATDTLVAINLLNLAVGAVGTRIRFGRESAFGAASPYADMARLIEAMGRGEIEVLILAGVNPVYALPPRAGFVEALEKVPLVVALASKPDETTARAGLVLPSLHWLESWGDYIAEGGITGLMQPAMGPVPVGGRPLEARSTGDILLAAGRRALGEERGQRALPWPSFAVFLREEWTRLAREVGGEPFVDFWEAALRRGGLFTRRGEPAVSVRAAAPAAAAAPAKLEGDGTHALLVYPSLRFYDGRGADRPWLQETPDPVTQVSWDAWVEVPAETAQRLELKRGDLVRLTSPHGSVELPAWISPSLHPGAVAVPMGQGHRFPGGYAQAGNLPPGAYAPPGQYLNVGANPVVLLPAAPEAASGALPYLAVRVTLAKTGARRALPVPQATFDQDDRELAQLVELGAARELELRGKAPEHASHPSMYPPVRYPQHRWGMTVDVDLCIGCAACVVACQAENNVPVVGREQVAYGRNQQWLRVERWIEGPALHPVNMFLPMFCQHCEIAPCEPVCPVYAAYHTQEGLNAQIYNRCVGTRYCGNNCPYHVRRFNWFNYTWAEPLDLQLNPDVTVRQLGIMEKCTMCVQRIEHGKRQASDEGRAVKDGDIMTACQQTCPTHAITFGNLKDGAARVSALSRSPRSYHVLHELGTRPAVTYLQKVVRQAPEGHGPHGKPGGGHRS
jgi:molybdopterin-containing oxidoreductase family iron-sulfur binding subunit